MASIISFHGRSLMEDPDLLESSGGMLLESSELLVVSNNLPTREINTPIKGLDIHPCKSHSTSASTILVAELIKCRSLSSQKPKQRPNCLFLNRLGTRGSPTPEATKTSPAVAACEAVLAVESGDFADPKCGLFHEIHSAFTTGIPKEPRSQSQAQDTPLELSSPLDQEFERPSTPKTSTDNEPLAIPSSSPSTRSHHSSPHDVPTDYPQDFPILDDFMGMYPDFEMEMNASAENARAMHPGPPVGLPADSFDCYPTESPTRRSNIIEVGLPTDLTFGPYSDDLDGAGIGFVVPPMQTTSPQVGRVTKKKEGVVKKCRFAIANKSPYPNTLKTQFRRRQQPSSPAFSRGYYFQGGPAPPPVFYQPQYAGAPVAVSPYQPSRRAVKVAVSSIRPYYGGSVRGAGPTRGPSYRRQPGSALSAMPQYSMASPLPPRGLPRRHLQQRVRRDSNPYEYPPQSYPHPSF